MKVRLTTTLHPYLFQRFREITGSKQMSQTIENILRQYNTDKVLETKRYKKVNYSVATTYTIDSQVLDDFIITIGRGKKSTIIGLLIKQYLERLNEL